METPPAPDIFFIILAIAAVIIAAILVRALIFVLGILRNAKNISDEARREMHAIGKDMDTIRRDLLKEERALRPTLRAVSRFFDPKKLSVKKHHSHPAAFGEPRLRRER